MPYDTTYYGYWLAHDGKQVVVDGHAYVIHATSSTTRYPIRRQVMDVFAEMCDKDCEAYRIIKATVGADWTTDLLDSPPEVSTPFLLAAEAQASPRKSSRVGAELRDGTASATRR